MPGMVHGGKAESSGQKSRSDERTSRPRPRGPEGRPYARSPWLMSG